MLSTKDKVLKEFSRIASNKKLGADVEFSFSNAGRIYFRKGLTL